MSIPIQKLLDNECLCESPGMRVESLLDEDIDSETDVRDSDADIPEAPHVIEDIRSNSAVLVEMKGYPRRPLGINLLLNDYRLL